MQRATAASQVSNLETALDTYLLEIGRYPETLEGLVENDTGRDTWNGPYLRGGLPKDPWGNDYFYQPGDKDFILMSYGKDVHKAIEDYGKDGTPGGEDDAADIGR